MQATASDAEPRWHFFVSYEQSDRRWAEWIAAELEAVGFRVLIQSWDLIPGSNWIDGMHQAVQLSDHLIALLSHRYLNSRYGTAEWQAFWQLDPAGSGRRILPIRVVDCERPGLLAGIVGIDMFGISEEEARSRLRRAAVVAVTGRGRPDGRVPYPEDRIAMPGHFPGTLPAVWNTPGRNPNFTGREIELVRLTESLKTHSTVTVHAIRGMGGVGKTQTAIEYAHRYAGDYQIVWWFNAEQAAAVPDQYSQLAVQLGLPQSADPDQTVRTVRRHLRSTGGWLLIFDNAEDVSRIRAFLPEGPGHALITTRHSGFEAVGEVLSLNVVSRSEAVALLRRRTTRLEAGEAERVADRLGDLPLALAQAAAYLDETGMSATEYLSMVGSRTLEILDRGNPNDYREAVSTVWSPSIEQIARSDPAAEQLLRLFAWLAPEPTPLELFTNHPDLLPAPLSYVASDKLRFNDAVAVLTEFALARRTEHGLIVHRLVQDVARATAPAGRAESLVTVLALLRAELPTFSEFNAFAMVNLEARSVYGRYLPHVLVAVGHHDDAIDLPEPTSWLLVQTGWYLIHQGRREDARRLIERNLRIKERTVGTADPDYASALDLYAVVLSSLVGHARALPLREQALRIRRRSPGPDPVDLAHHVESVGLALAELGEHEKAVPLLEQARDLFEASRGPNHPMVGYCLQQLGRALLEMGRPGEALPLLDRAHRIHVDTQGPRHPIVARDLTQRARALSDLNRLEEATQDFEQALELTEAIYGPNHPDVTESLQAAGWVLHRRGRDNEALPLLERLVHINEDFYGDGHFDVGLGLGMLSEVLICLDRAEEALPLLHRSRRIAEETFGHEHRAVALAMRRLADAYRRLGQPDLEAQSLCLAADIEGGASPPAGSLGEIASSG
jgi:tetratricopeptide (TPR) repeat protein